MLRWLRPALLSLIDGALTGEWAALQEGLMSAQPSQANIRGEGMFRQGSWTHSMAHSLCVCECRYRKAKGIRI